MGEDLLCVRAIHGNFFASRKYGKQIFGLSPPLLELAGKLGGIDKWRGGEFAQPAKTLFIPLLWKIVGTARRIAPSFPLRLEGL
jgi:hypothetical protein